MRGRATGAARGEPSSVTLSQAGIDWGSAGFILYLPAAVLALAWIGVRGGAAAIPDRIAGDAPLTALLAGTAAGLIVASLSRALVEASRAARAMADAFGRVLGELPPPERLAIAFSSAVGEELLFRGALQPEVGWMAASVIFGLLHVPLERGLLLWPLFATGVGLLLGWLAEETGSLVAPIACHLVVNLLNLRVLAARERVIRSTESPPRRLRPSRGNRESGRPSGI